MCGIAAVFRPKAYSAEPFVRMMLGRIRHRGFSYDEVWSSPTVALGANRLQIVDPAGGRQPVSNEEGNLLAILDGEIYNYRTLFRELCEKGHRFRSDCDTEVLVHAFEEWGLKVFDHLLGMFCCVLYNKTTDDFIVARDPIGVKPIYVGRGRDGSFFACSEAKALVGLVASVKLLPPGHFYNGSQCICYVPSDKSPFGDSFSDAAEQLSGLISDAVAIRLPHGLPVAVFLSSGIDSSLILTLAARARADLIAISFGLPGSLEIERAREYCRSLGVQHEVVGSSFEHLLSRYEQVVYHLESFEPNLVRASLITYALCERARQLGVRVALAGEGADELFGGYDDFVNLSAEDLDKSLGAFLNDLHRTQLLRWDKMGMAHTVEIRTPFMDRRIVAFSRSLPAQYKVRNFKNSGRVSKAVLREAAKNLLPASITERAKIPMDEGAFRSGAPDETDAFKVYFESFPEVVMANEIRENFSVTNKEELINLSTLMKYLPLDYIEADRPTVRRSLS